MLDLEGFRALYPSFRSIIDSTVTKALNQAEARTESVVFGDLTDEAHGVLTASILHVNMFVGVRQSKDDPASKDVYIQRRRELEAVVGGFQGGAL